MSKKYSIITLLITLGVAIGLSFFYLTAETQYQAQCKHVANGCHMYSGEEEVARIYFEVEKNAFIQPFHARVSGKNIDTASIEISGINYYMGYNHYSLRDNGVDFTYKGVLPSCIYRDMMWRVTVRVTKGTTSYAANYDFSIIRNVDELT